MRADYLILGNSAAGASAAEAIRAVDSNGSIVIASPEPHSVYGRPLISYLLEGKTSLERIGYKDAGFYERLGIETLLGPGNNAVRLDAGSHRVAFSNGKEIEYGRCLIATGSIPFTPPIEGLDKAQNATPFLTLDNALKAQELADRARVAAQAEGRESRAIVIGAGLIGLKAAEAISHSVDRVLVLELAPRILPAVLDAEGARLLQGMLAHHGIECRPGVSAQKILVDDGIAHGALLTDGTEEPCDFIVAAVGVRPNTAFAVEAGAAQGRGLVCGPDLQTSLPDVYAAGDVVQVRDALDGTERPLALWPNAVRQGTLAGRHMAQDPSAPPFDTSFAVNAVDFFEASLLTAGLINPPDGAEGVTCDVRIDEVADTYAKLVVRDGKLAGYILLNRPANAGIYTWLIEHETPLASLDPAMFDSAPFNCGFDKTMRWERLHAGYPANRNEKGFLAKRESPSAS